MYPIFYVATKQGDHWLYAGQRGGDFTFIRSRAITFRSPEDAEFCASLWKRDFFPDVRVVEASELKPY